MKMLTICRLLAICAAGLVCVILLAAPVSIAQETEDSQVFLSGFNAYQQKDYRTAVVRLGEVLQKHPETPLRDMTLFWLARSHYKAGNRPEAARYMAQFIREYPDNPLKNTVEDELLALAASYEKSGQAASVAKAEEEARQRAEAARQAQEQAEREAAALAEKARILKAKAEEERRTREKAEAERLAQLKQEEERKAQEAAEQKRRAALQAEAERKAREEAERERLARQKAEEEQRSAQKAEAAAAEQRALREKAIAEYQRILAQFPGTPAAKVAATRLKELGIAITVPSVATDAAVAADNVQVLSLEVAQYAAFEFTMQGGRQPVEVGRSAAIPFELVNRGNGADSFYLASGFPAEYNVRFAAAATPQQIINQTPQLGPGERFNGLLLLTVPTDAIDGLRVTYPVKAASRFSAETSQSRELSLTVAAPLLRAMVKADKTQAVPGERVQYRITVLNVGSMPASEVSLRVNFPPQYEPVELAGFRQEMQAALVQDGLMLKSGESRDFVVSFAVKEGALAKEELVVRADLLNTPLKAVSTFHAAAVYVQPVSAVAVKMASARVVAIPGQTVTLPVTVVNNGNQRERFTLAASVPASQKVTLYHDLNRDGLRQPTEPEVATIGPLGPKEEAALLVEVATSRTAPDGTETGVTVTVAAESGQGKPAVAEARLGFSRPLVQLALKGRSGLLVPGELLTVDLVVHNQGSNLAKGVELKASWPEQLELVAAEPAVEATAGAGGATWRLNELGAGEKRVVKASFRVKPGTGVGTGIQLKSVISYSDQLGNRY